MNILYITSSFQKKGSASVRNISLVNGLIENGATVDVLTQSWPNHMIDLDFMKITNNKTNIYYDKIRVIELYFNKINSLQLNKNKKNRKIFSSIKKLIKQVYYFPDIDKEWIKNYNKQLNYKQYDLIISSSDTKTAHLVVNKLRKAAPNAKWFQIWGDPWVDDHGTRGIRKLFAYFYEKQLIEKADKVFYVSHPTLNAMKIKYSKSSNKMHYIKRSYIEEIIGETNNEDEYIFSYIGSIYYGRNILPLVESIKEYNLINKKKIILNIYGTYSNEIENECIPYGFVKFNGYISHNEVVLITSKSDCLIFMSNMKNSHQIPGKLFDYFGTNKSILALVESTNNDVAKFIQKTNRCILFENDKDMIDLNYVVNQILNKNQKVLKEYSKKNVAKELLEHLKE